MLKIYGSMQCPDCVKCREELDGAGVAYEYLDLGESLRYLKEFLQLRDRNVALEAARREGFIGIPCILREDGSVTLSWEEFM